MNSRISNTASPLDALRFDNSYARLDASFYSRVGPAPLPEPYLVASSPAAARLLGLDPRELESTEVVETLAGNRTPAGAEPLAAVYSGHQFGVWAGRLGDGRALLLGEIAAPGGARWEVQLKGSGQTPYSRMGDGRAVLRSSIREFLCSEAMHALGIPTTRALAVVGSDHPVVRESVETAAVVTRLSPSFVRFGSFEHFYYAGRHAELRTLADHVIERHFAALRSAPEPYFELLREVVCRTASLIARWQSVGFCHGVMNTDNMSILGLTIDYGPFAFLDAFDPGYICNHSDTSGRYSYAMQPVVGEWNCGCLAQAMVPLVGSVARAEDALAEYRPVFEAEFDLRLREKLGLLRGEPGDGEIFNDLFRLLAAHRVDFTRFFRELSKAQSDGDRGDAACRSMFPQPRDFDEWVSRYRGRLRSEARPDAERTASMDRVNPKYVLRNYLAENAIRAARGGDELARLAIGEAAPLAPGQDFTEVRRLLELLSHPFDEQPEMQAYANVPPSWAASIALSCSS